jgi:carbamoyl-phosphate synthase/aspartate carbamoyltransferase
VPAMYGVDTRALTERIRQEGSMLGRMLLQKHNLTNGHSSGANTDATGRLVGKDWRPYFESHDWVNPNTKNLVAEGELSVTAFTGIPAHQRQSLSRRYSSTDRLPRLP